MRILLLSLISFLLSGCWVFAESSTLSHVSAAFCAQEKGPFQHAAFVGEAGQTYPLCLEFVNDGDVPIDVSFDFVDGMVSADSLHTKACGTSTASFASYLSLPTAKLRLPSHRTTFLTGVFSFPLGYSGHIQGCLVYLPIEKNVSDDMFSVVVRKANFFEGDIVGVMKRGISLGTLSAEFSGRSHLLHLRFPVVNTGTFDEQVVLSGVLFNGLGYERSIVFSSVVQYGASVVLDRPVLDIPFYQGKFSFSGVITSSVTTGSLIVELPKKFSSPVISSVSFSFFLWPWKWILGILLSFIVVFVFLKGRRG